MLFVAVKPFLAAFRLLHRAGSLLAAATDPTIPEVMVYFKGQLLRGNRVRKLSALDFAAFDSGAFPVLGSWGGSLDLFSEQFRVTPLSLLDSFVQYVAPPDSTSSTPQPSCFDGDIHLALPWNYW